MNTEVQSLKDLISERVGKELVNLIPKDQWDALIQQQVNHFMLNTAPGIIKEELGKSLRENLHKHLSTSQEWDVSCQRMINPLVKETILKSAPEIMSAMLTPIMNGVIDQLRNNLYNQGRF